MLRAWTSLWWDSVGPVSPEFWTRIGEVGGKKRWVLKPWLGANKPPYVIGKFGKSWKMQYRVFFVINCKPVVWGTPMTMENPVYLLYIYWNGTSWASASGVEELSTGMLALADGIAATSKKVPAESGGRSATDGFVNCVDLSKPSNCLHFSVYICLIILLPYIQLYIYI